MKKLLLGITLLAALFAGNLMAEETNGGWVWVGTEWVYTASSNGVDPIPLPPPPPIR